MNASDLFAQGNSIEDAANNIDRHDLIDSSAPNLLEVSQALLLKGADTYIITVNVLITYSNCVQIFGDLIRITT